MRSQRFELIAQQDQSRPPVAEIEARQRVGLVARGVDDQGVDRSGGFSFVQNVIKRAARHQHDVGCRAGCTSDTQRHGLSGLLGCHAGDRKHFGAARGHQKCGEIRLRLNQHAGPAPQLKRCAIRADAARTDLDKEAGLGIGEKIQQPLRLVRRRGHDAASLLTRLAPTRPLDDPGGAEAGDQIDQDDLAALLLDQPRPTT